MSLICKKWIARLDTMPPSRGKLYVEGGIEVANLGVEASLKMRSPQGFNPTIIILDLSTRQKPGMWPQQIVCADVHLAMDVQNDVTAVEIMKDGERIVLIDHIERVS